MNNEQLVSDVVVDCVMDVVVPITGYVGFNAAIGRWQPDTVEPIVQATPTIYVDADATGAEDGSSWTDAYTTIMAAHTAASGGDVISISGGTIGKTYTENLSTLNKAVTIQGSTEPGHNGLVTVNGALYINLATGTITLNNFKMTIENFAGGQCFRFYQGTTIHNNMVYGPFSSTNSNNIIHNTSKHTFNYCTFLRTGYKISTAETALLTPLAAVELAFNFCTFDHAGSIPLIIGTGHKLIINNCTVLPYKYSDRFLNIGNSALNEVNINRTVFFGISPVTSGANSVLNVERCFWTKQPGITNIGSNSPYFDSSNIATITNSIDHIDPKFVKIKNTKIGQFFLRYDDRNNLDISTTTAQTLNPEIVLTHAVDLHGRTTATRPSAQDIDDMRTLIANGNEIICHGADHSNSADMGTINISATGTSPTLDIVATQAGDSTTWSNVLTITINSVSQNFDLMTSSYDTKSELIAALNGASIGDGTVTCTDSNTQNQSHSFTGTLAAVSSQDISTTYEVSNDRTAYNQYQITEAIADLEAYINDAQDRNGNNAVSGTTVDAPSPAYICKGYASPYGLGDSTIVTLLQNDSNILHGQAAYLVNDGDYYARGVDENIYNNRYQQITDTNESDDLFSLSAVATSGPFVSFALYHGGTPSYNGSLANFKAMLIALGVGDQTMSEYFNYIRTDGAWTITEPNASFTGTADDYLSQGDFSLQDDSPLLYSD